MYTENHVVKVGYRKEWQLRNKMLKRENIIRQLKPLCFRSKELIGNILTYFADQEVLKEEHKRLKSYDSKSIKYNRIDLSFDSFIFSQTYPNINIVRKKKEVFKKAVEDLIVEDILYPHPTKDKVYLVNPLYYYDGVKFLDVYMYWCHTTNTPIHSKFLKNCLREGDKYFQPDLQAIALLLAQGITEY